MRTSERVAVGAVLAMILPAFLAFPALGVCYVVRVWPALGVLERAVLALSAAALLVTIPHVFRGRLDLFFYGRTKTFSFLEQFLVLAPAVMAMWAVTHQWFLLIGIAIFKFLLWETRLFDALEGKADVRAYTTRSDAIVLERGWANRAGRMLRRLRR